jgi:2'-5' RNA ligase
VRDRIDTVARRLQQDLHPRGRWIRPERYHLTLRFLGTHVQLPDDLLAAAHAAGESVRTRAFEFALDVAASFANRHVPWWLGCREIAPALAALAAALDAAFRTSGCAPRDDAPFVPHLTILRDADRVLAPMPIEPVVWPVDEFVLVDSVLAAQSRHVILRRWALSH